MISDIDLNQALSHLDKHQFACLREHTTYGILSRKARDVRREATRLLLEEYAAGTLQQQAVKSVRWSLLKRAGFDPTVWLLIFRLVVAIAPILWDWWQNRQQTEGWGHA